MGTGLHKVIYLLAAAMLMVSACRRENPWIAEGGDVRTEDAGITVVMDAATKASFDFDGSGRYANRCRLQIYSGNTLYYDRTVEVVDYKAKFNDIQLDRSRVYDYLFWADNKEGNYYETGDLRHITLNGAYIGSNDARDAFYGSALQQQVVDMCDTTLILKRPFAQLNIITDDIPDLYAQLPEKKELDRVLPDSVYIKINNVATCFDVSAGTAGEYAPIETSTPVYTPEWKHQEGDRNTLSMDYFFASDEADSRVSEVDFKFCNSAEGLVPTEYHLTNVPLRRNWRTNIQGCLLTTKGKVNVTISHIWEDEYNK